MLTTNASSTPASSTEQRQRVAGPKPHRRASMSPEDHATPDSTVLQSVLEIEADGPTFAGEATMSPNFKGALDPQTTSPVTGGGLRPDSLIPMTDMDAPSTGQRKLRGWLEKIFAEHGLVADEAEWRRYLHVFLEEIHVLYPFLHPPALWQAFEEMWEYSALWVMSDTVEREQKQMSVALVCFCLGLGRCSVSTRMEDLDGVHSAGWTMYSAGMSLIQHEAGEASSLPATMLLAFQTSIARVCLPPSLHLPRRQLNANHYLLLGDLPLSPGCRSKSSPTHGRPHHKRPHRRTPSTKDSRRHAHISRTDALPHLVGHLHPRPAPGT